MIPRRQPDRSRKPAPSWSARGFAQLAARPLTDRGECSPSFASRCGSPPHHRSPFRSRRTSRLRALPMATVRARPRPELVRPAELPERPVLRAARPLSAPPLLARQATKRLHWPLPAPTNGEPTLNLRRAQQRSGPISRSRACLATATQRPGRASPAALPTGPFASSANRCQHPSRLLLSKRLLQGAPQDSKASPAARAIARRLHAAAGLMSGCAVGAQRPLRRRMRLSYSARAPLNHVRPLRQR